MSARRESTVSNRTLSGRAGRASAPAALDEPGLAAGDAARSGGGAAPGATFSSARGGAEALGADSRQPASARTKLVRPSNIHTGAPGSPFSASVQARARGAAR